jgi:predicted DNA-binding ribbon-helix-helix protein
VRKRSLTIAGHRTSIALEPQFWTALEAIADEQRQDTNLSSSIRVAVLVWYQARSEAATGRN